MKTQLEGGKGVVSNSSLIWECICGTLNIDYGDIESPGCCAPDAEEFRMQLGNYYDKCVDFWWMTGGWEEEL